MTTALTFTRREYTVVETGKEIRRALREAFPGVKFSLRGSRGTGYGWFSLDWTDGPTTRQVDALTNSFRSSYFDGMDDSTHTIPATMYAGDDGEVVEHRYSCNGVNSQRGYGPEADQWARTYIDAHGGPELFCGDYHADHGLATWRVLQHIDLTGVDWSAVPPVTPGYAGRRVPNSYCVETGREWVSEYAPTHRAELVR